MKKCEYSKIKKGDFYSRISYGQVIGKVGNMLKLKNESGKEWDIEASIVEGEFYICNQYENLEEVTKTEMAKVLLQHPRMVMTVRFTKKLDMDWLRDRVDNLYTESQTKRAFRDMMIDYISCGMFDGEERSIIGYHYGKLDDLGYLPFVELEVEKDLTKDYDNRTKRVSINTLKEMIVCGVKYTLKR